MRYAKGHRPTTCYAYNSDLGLWRDWLSEAGKDWQRARTGRRGAVRRLAVARAPGERAHRQPPPERPEQLLQVGAASTRSSRPIRSTWPTSPSARCGSRSGWKRRSRPRLEATLKDRRNIPINIFGDNQAAR
ncbi:MAG: hypothetical protein MZV65_16460 [Chromatiales bacterium]|nr:hypothetical protein [Chromatiales bacterium]